MKQSLLKTRLWVGVGLVAVLGVAGCASSSETAERDTMTAHVGNYSAPPPGVERVRVGIPAFEVTDPSLRGENLEAIAADQLTTLAFNTQRFNVVERSQLSQVMKEQDLEGIVREDELAQKSQVRGVQYLFIGKVTNLRVKAESSSRGFGIGRVTRYVGGFDFKKKSSRIQVDCGVDLRLVDSTTGELVSSHFGEYKRTDSIGAFGIDILGASAEADADLRVDSDNKGKILRLALDEAVRKMLPQIDQALSSRG